MTELAGQVAILSEDGQSVTDVRDLGPVPVPVKAGRVLPLITLSQDIPPGYVLGTVPTYTVLADRVEVSYGLVAIPAPIGFDVDAERERRIALPLSVAVPSGASFPINMDPEAQRNIQGLATAGILLNATAPSQETNFRDYENQTHALMPGDLIAMGLQVMARIQAVYQKSWALKAMSPIPADYADDSYWS